MLCNLFRGEGDVMKEEAAWEIAGDEGGRPIEGDGVSASFCLDGDEEGLQLPGVCMDNVGSGLACCGKADDDDDDDEEETGETAVIGFAAAVFILSAIGLSWPDELSVLSTPAFSALSSTLFWEILLELPGKTGCSASAGMFTVPAGLKL